MKDRGELQQALTADTKASMSRRDAIVGDLPRQIGLLKERIFHRLSALTGDFSSWIGSALNVSVSGGSKMQGSEELRSELEAAGREAQGIEDPSELIQFIVDWTEKIEALDDIRCGLLKLDRSIQRALEVGQTAVAEKVA